MHSIRLGSPIAVGAVGADLLALGVAPTVTRAANATVFAGIKSDRAALTTVTVPHITAVALTRVVSGVHDSCDVVCVAEAVGGAGAVSAARRVAVGASDAGRAVAGSGDHQGRATLATVAVPGTVAGAVASVSFVANHTVGVAATILGGGAGAAAVGIVLVPGCA